ncbi:MAG: aminotransferase class V-fold PLP-dependent enzyme [Planctomycetota bacterium]
MRQVYLNQAGTSWPKPACVQDACQQALHTDVSEWAGHFTTQHEQVARYFGIHDPAALLLTPGCTSALHLAVEDHDWQTGDAVCSSSFEHHALHRPLLKLTQRGVDLHVIPPAEDSAFSLPRLEEILSSRQVKLVAVTAASNVTGDLLPIQGITTLAHRHGAKVLIDGAQLVGWFELILPDSEYDLFAFGGHKGLLAPWGIGGLYMRPGLEMSAAQATCSIDSGTKNCSSQPSYCDVGSVDRIALAGLSSSTNWIRQQDESNILARCRDFIGQMQAVLRANPKVSILGNLDVEQRLPTIAFQHHGLSNEQIAEHLLANRVTSATGLQCAPMAHEMLGTAPEGVIRLSVGAMNTQGEIDLACDALRKIRR